MKTPELTLPVRVYADLSVVSIERYPFPEIVLVRDVFGSRETVETAEHTRPTETDTTCFCRVRSLLSMSRGFSNISHVEDLHHS